MILKSTAIVIKAFSYGDSSLIGRVLLDSGEKISMMIKGGKSMKSNKNALFQSMNLIRMDYYYKENRELQMFKEGNLIDSFSQLKTSFESMKYGLSMIDMIDKALPKGYQDQRIFDVAYKCLSLINRDYDYKIIFIFFLLSFSHYNGYGINQFQFNSLKSDEVLYLFMKDSCDENIIKSMEGIDLDEVIKRLLSFIQSHISEIKNVKSLKFVN